MAYVMVLLVSLLALVYAAYDFVWLRKMPEGTDEMVELAGIIRQGARTFMRAEYRIIVPVVAVVAIVISCFVEKTSGFSFILGAAMSSAACILGMHSATYANVRTTNTARITEKDNETIQVCWLGGTIVGRLTNAFGLLGLIIILLVGGRPRFGLIHGGLIASFPCSPSIMRIITYSLGCSLVAMFNRIAGGNYTKAADISADIVAKVRNDLPEDDSRMPNTIADFIGDIINDIAGNASDLLESFVATLAAVIILAISIGADATPELLNATIDFPVIIAGIGLTGCLIGIVYTQAHEASDDPAKELNTATYIAAVIIACGSLAAAKYYFGDLPLYDTFRFGWISPWLCVVIGLTGGIIVGIIVKYYTSTDYSPVQNLAKISTEGDAFVITKGDAIGSRSCLPMILVFAVGIIASGIICGLYGISISAVGMLSIICIIVSIDAFGPIADNAGGIAESCHLGAPVRAITDKLDAYGNTSAATGKGFAIGGAANTTVSLIFAYVGGYTTGTPVLNIANYMVVSGSIAGGAFIEYFSAILTDNTIESARLMADEGDRQLSIPGVLEGTVKPDYDLVISMAAHQALKKMLLPSLLSLFVPVIGGLLFGADFVGGILIGATIVAIPRAVFMSNSGGAFDNAKKFIESGQLEGHAKGSDAHKATVVGDTVGDTRKDVVGVSLDIAIKLMSTVANTLAPVFASIHLF